MGEDRLHEITAEQDDTGVWLHTCTVCGEQSRGDAPTLPCPGPSQQNTDRELYREPRRDLPSDYYANSVHVTEHGGIGMNVGGYVVVKPIADWHRLAMEEVFRTTACTCEPDRPEVCEHCFVRSQLGIAETADPNRDALALLLQSADVKQYRSTSVWKQYADVILAAGWTAPTPEVMRDA